MYKLKKIASLFTSAITIGSTFGIAMAANYPAPFVQNGAANVAIVYGSTSQPSDLVAATAINTDLTDEVVSNPSGGGTPSTVDCGTDECASLADGGDYIYLNDELNENVATLSKDELPTILMDGTFTDDDGEDYDYEQTIVVESGATFAFDNSDNDLDDPALLIALPEGTISASADKVYTSTVTFNDAINFTATESEGETIEIFSNTYTVGTATDADTLVLLGGSDTETVDIGETVTLAIGEESYDVTLNAISDSDTPSASITVNGETKTFTEGQTKSFAGGDADLFVKTVFRTGDNAGYVELILGADKLTLETGNEVQKGSDDEEVDGTLVTITGGIGAMTKLEIAVSADDSDNNHLLVGEKMTDPVFGAFSVNFQGVENGPTLDGREDTNEDRMTLSIDSAGNRELVFTATNNDGDTKTDLPLAYNNASTNSDGDLIHLIEGANMMEDSYVTLNSGNNQYFVRLTNLELTAGGDSTDDVEFTDLFSGEKYEKENTNFSGSGATLNIGGQTFTIVQNNATSISVRSSDYSTNLAVYPYVELVSGKDHRLAITDQVTISETATATGTSSDETKLYELPTGNIKFEYTNNSASWTYTIDGGTETTGSALEDTYTVGSVDYVINISHTTNTSLVVNWIAPESTQSTSDVQWDAPALLFVEEEDESESSSGVENAVFLKTTDDGSYSYALSPVFTGTRDTANFDDTDYTGYVTNFGTYVLFDSSDDDQDLVSLTYPEDQMYADVWFAEDSATIGESSSSSGAPVVVTDAEASTMTSKNLIVVGGSCVNTVAAELLGSSTPLCGDAWMTKTGVGAGSFLIETFARSGGKVATLVAGYNAGDTTNAATALTTQDVSTTVGDKYTGSTSDSITLATA